MMHDRASADSPSGTQSTVAPCTPALLVDDGGGPCDLDGAEVQARFGVELSLQIHFDDDEVRRAVTRDAERAAEHRANRRLLDRYGQDLIEPARLLERVYVGDAGALGHGLFAVDALRNDTVVAIYTGDIQRDQGINRHDPYLVSYHRSFRCPNGLFCRASDFDLDLSAQRRGGPARWINGSKSQPPNLQVQVVAHDGLFWPLLTTTRRVARGEQLKWDYGEAYWISWGHAVEHLD
ncbi:MAG: SET domain-containing protein-lysine N-methyltransferase [Pseudomonadota bacterium]